jgi:toxin-antitoxin system PIN domain toxin
MLSFDTNIAVHAANSASPQHAAAAGFLASLAKRKDVAVCELVLVELYLKLRNERIFSKPLSAARAAAVCEPYRNNRSWMLIESAPVMAVVWEHAAKKQFAFRRIIDVRLGLTLRHHGVTEFATSNVKDFRNLGFTKLWNPLESP